MSDKYPCPCCGYYTFSEQPPGTSQFCEICFWDDIPVNQHWQYSYIDAICIAQKNFLEIGASSPDFINTIRKPASTDKRLVNWKPLSERIEEERIALVQDINDAFRDVELGDGVSLHEADVIDGYGTMDERKKARLLDAEKSWQGISEDKLWQFQWGPFSFMNEKGKRFYLPAFMTYSLKKGDAGQHALFCIEHLEANEMHVFTLDQLRVMVRYALFKDYTSGLDSRSDQFIKRVKRNWGTVWNDELLNPYRV
jgi:hypothetical protein